MDFERNVLELRGDCTVKTTLNLDSLTEKVSKAICGGITFTYGKHSIWEEIPSKYIDSSILGMLIIVGGYGGDDGFQIAIWQYGEFGRYLYSNKIETKRVNLDLYLYHLLKQGLKEYPEIDIIYPQERI